jgi:hypothetical protein
MSRGFDHRIPRAFALGCMLFSAIMTGCRRAPEPPREADELQDRVEEGRERHQQLVAEVQGLATPELIARLRTDSRNGVEPFNSLAYRETVRRGAAASATLTASITGTDRSFLLPLLALRAIGGRLPPSPNDSAKAAILVGALRESETFNIWGLPHLYWEDAAKAILELGAAARPGLIALLDDARPAPVWGSEEVAEYNRYRYRVGDYALALLLGIQGQTIALPADPAARDSLKRSVVQVR